MDKKTIEANVDGLRSTHYRIVTKFDRLPDYPSLPYIMIQQNSIESIIRIPEVLYSLIEEIYKHKDVRISYIETSLTEGIL